MSKSKSNGAEPEWFVINESSLSWLENTLQKSLREVEGLKKDRADQVERKRKGFKIREQQIAELEYRLARAVRQNEQLGKEISRLNAEAWKYLQSMQQSMFRGGEEYPG